MTPELYLDVFIIDNEHEKSNEIRKQPEIKQRELSEFN